MFALEGRLRLAQALQEVTPGASTYGYQIHQLPHRLSMTLTLLRLLVLVLSGLTALTARAQQPIDTLHIAILGDSNTWLGGDECQQPEGWTFHFNQALRPASCRSYARSGATWTHTTATTANVEEYTEVITPCNVIYNQCLRLIADVQTGRIAEPTLILIAAGTNDAWFHQKQRKGCLDLEAKLAFQSPTDEVMQKGLGQLSSLAEAVRYDCLFLQRKFPAAHIVLLTPLPSLHAGKAAIERAANCIEKCGHLLHIPVIRQDLEGCIRYDTERHRLTYTTDGTHMNAAAARKIGRFIARRVQPLL